MHLDPGTGPTVLGSKLRYKAQLCDPEHKVFLSGYLGNMTHDNNMHGDMGMSDAQPLIGPQAPDVESLSKHS